MMKNNTRSTLRAGAALASVLGVCLSAATTLRAWEYRPHAGPTENTVLLYRLNETSGDTVFNDKHARFSNVGDGRTNGAPVRGLASVNASFGTAYGCSPSNHVAYYYPSSTNAWNDLSGTTHDLTVEAWVKWNPATSTAGRQSLVEMRLVRGTNEPYAGTGNWWTLTLERVSDTTARLILSQSGNVGIGFQQASQTVVWDSNVWHHVAFTKRYYLNGTTNRSDYCFYVTPTTSTTYPVNVGSFPALPDFYVPRSGGGPGLPPLLKVFVGAGPIGAFNGLLDEVRISNAVVSDFPASDRTSGTLVTLR